MSMASMAVIGLTSVGLVGLHIHGEPAGSVIDPTASCARCSIPTLLGLHYSLHVGFVHVVPLGIQHTRPRAYAVERRWCPRRRSSTPCSFSRTRW